MKIQIARCLLVSIFVLILIGCVPTLVPVSTNTFTPTSTDMATPTPTLTPTLPPTPTPSPTPICRSGFVCNLTPAENGAQSCIDTIALEPPREVSRIYIDMNKRALPNFGFSIWEVRVYESATSTTNLMATPGAQVTAKSTEDSRFISQRVIDGKIGGDFRWGSALCCQPFGTCPANNTGGLQCNVDGAEDPQWLDITLLKPATIGRIEIEWQDAYALDYCVATFSDK